MSSTEGNNGQRQNRKICKACDPCRLRKVRCDGAQPCSQVRCREDPSLCTYREKARVRRSRHGARVPRMKAPESSRTWHESNASSARSPSEENSRVEPPPAKENAPTNQRNHISSDILSPRARPRASNDHALNPHVSIVATHETPQSTDSPQLFYGPSSNFAFLQQLHRGILTKTARGRRRRGSDVEEGGPGLDMFLQRSIFFGTPQRVRLDSIFPTGSALIPQVDLSQAGLFLEKFKQAHSHLYPFLTPAELDTLQQQLRQDLSIITGEAQIPPQKRIIVVAVLALGALSTPCTEQAEYLYAVAKREALFFSEAVTLSMIQYSILLAGYQIYTGRPNPAYLHVGTASRIAFSMGLHRDSPAREGHMGNIKERQATLWSLYFHERWTCLTLGRKGAISIHDISCPFPEDLPVMTAMCQLACITEDCVELIYTRRCESIRQLYVQAENIHNRLRKFGDKFKIGPSFVLDSADHTDISSFQLNAHFYHAILLTFRPFLVANAVMSSQARQKEGMWLRQACRYAVGAAQDSITYISDMFQSSTDAELCKSLRYTCYFLECCCSVLLHDSLWSPSTMPHNLEYIQMAMKCIEAIVDDIPATIGLQSIRRVLQAVEHAIAHNDSSTASTPAGEQGRSGIQTLPTPISGSVEVPSADQQHIYFTDLWDPNIAGSPSTAMPGWEYAPQDVNFDVMTTDLLHFFAPDGVHMDRNNVL